MPENEVDPPTPKAPDRRSLRSQHALLAALIDLMAVKTYDSISIKELVEKANVGRATFYAHYQTKDDLIKAGFERILDETIDHIALSQDGHNLIVDTTPLFQHAAGHYHLYKTLMWGSGFEILTKDELVILSDKIHQRLAQFFPDQSQISVPLPVLSSSFSGNLLILLKWWLDNKMPFPPEKMNESFQILVMPGIKAALEPRRH
jgi:AcrR family transcriptional regulator